MPIELCFHGAAGVVTGSCIELRHDGKTILIDCGLFQGSRTLEALNYEGLPFDPADVSLVVLTHAHLDHSGRLPLLVKQGLRAPIVSLPPNRALLGPLLSDAARLQAADAERRNERPDRLGLTPFEPLYDFNDVERLVELVQSLRPERWSEPLPGFKLRFWDAHHILGAASVEFEIDGQSLLFSGDIGDGATRVADPPSPGQGWDHVICEATYGDRDRVIPSIEQRRELLAAAVSGALAHGGNLVIPAFALERTQILIEDLVALFDSCALPATPVFVDAPLADRVTRAYRLYETPRPGPSPFDHPKVRFTRSIDESKTLNRMSGAIIIAGSGMCAGGRVRYHLQRNLPRGDSTILFVGYQARGTLGAVLKDGARQVRISGGDVPVRAHIATLDAYSAHADHAGLMRWIGNRLPIKGSLFLDHGETAALQGLAHDAAGLVDTDHIVVPALGEQFLLEPATAAQRIGAGRADAAALSEAMDWRGRQAALQEALASHLAALPNDRARVAALDAIQRSIAGLASRDTMTR
jgi:metallo-beta-lactamase family protein